MKGIIKAAKATLFAVFALTAAALTTAAVTTSAKAAGENILTVEYVNQDGTVSQSLGYTLDDLRAMPAASFETETIWTEGKQSFTGVPLVALIGELGLEAGEIEAVAINAYSVKIPVSDAVDGGPIIAFERNGDQMSIRAKGPLWVVYPYDSDPVYRTEAVYSRSIWQLEKLIIKK